MTKKPGKDVQKLLSNPEEFISRLCIMNKHRQRLSRFEMNLPQKRLLGVLENHNRVVVLKARQLGVSTLTRAWHFWKAYMSDQPTQYAVISHTRDSAEELHRMEKTFYENLPAPLKRPLARSSTKTLKFEDSGAELRTYTAGGKGGTRSYAMNSVHLSEFAFYEDQEETMATVMAAVGEGQIVIESTPNAHGDMFHDLVRGAMDGENGWELVFFPWFVHPQYQDEVPGWYVPNVRESSLLKEHDLCIEQLFWRRKQLKTLGTEKFIREYPSTVEEAFRSTGQAFFDHESLEKIEPLNLGKHEHREYAKPVEGDSYVLGVDVGSGLGGKHDFSAVSVVSVSTRQPVYHYISNTTPPSQLADRIVSLWDRYNYPRVIVEANGNGQWVIHRLREMKVRNLFKGENGRDFRTTVRTRPLIFNALKAVVDSDMLHSLDKEVVEEFKSIVYLKDKPQAPKKKHDDVTISMALCYYYLEKIPLTVSHSVKRAMMDKHIDSMRAKRCHRIVPWDVTGGDGKGGWR